MFEAFPAEALDTVKLSQMLVRLDTTNPPGNETLAAALLAERLQASGVNVELHWLAPGRASLIARLNDQEQGPALCLCGHLDTVPLGQVPWTRDPFGGDIIDGRIWGRGTTDMKAGVAAMVTAFERLAQQNSDRKIVLVLCASEETGCQGAAQVADKTGPVGAIVIAEPTNGDVAIAHKGVLWLRLTTRGKAAHGSMPHLGVNAIDRMAEAIARLRALKFDVDPHPLLGVPTHNLGTISGGSATNIVPDVCECMLDVRLTPGLSADAARRAVETCVGSDVAIQTILALDAVASDPNDPWIKSVLQQASNFREQPIFPISVSYFTDASVLARALGFPPVVIIGPGDPTLAHQVDESCSVSAIWRSSQLFERLAKEWQP